MADEFTFPVEAGHITMFARALGDENPAYREGDDSAEAPPTFVACSAHFDPEWPYRPRPGVPWNGSGRGPGTVPESSGSGTSMQAEQHYEYHLPIRAGDVLTVAREAGDEWTKESRRAGTLHFSEEITRYRNHEGDLVLTARRVRVITERTVER